MLNRHCSDWLVATAAVAAWSFNPSQNFANHNRSRIFIHVILIFFPWMKTHEWIYYSHLKTTSYSKEKKTFIQMLARLRVAGDSKIITLKAVYRGHIEWLFSTPGKIRDPGLRANKLATSHKWNILIVNHWMLSWTFPFHLKKCPIFGTQYAFRNAIVFVCLIQHNAICRSWQALKSAISIFCVRMSNSLGHFFLIRVFQLPAQKFCCHLRLYLRKLCIEYWQRSDVRACVLVCLRTTSTYLQVHVRERTI